VKYLHPQKEPQPDVKYCEKFFALENFFRAKTKICNKEHTMTQAKKEGIVVVDLDSMDLSQLDEDSQIEIVLAQLDEFALQLESRGIAIEIVDTALFSVFVGRLNERGDRQSFDAYVEEAQEEPWETVVLH
jgi:hypothetical protein